MSEVAITTQQEAAVATARPKATETMPAHIVQAMRLAKTLSDSSLIPKALQNKPADVLVVLLKGEELGLQPIQALGSIHVIEGKACCSSELTVALVLRSGKAEYFDLVETSAKVATYRTKRVGSKHETVMSFTIEEAAAAGLIGKQNWKGYPAAMLRARCAQHLARAVYQEVTLGLIEEDEADDMKRRLMAAVEESPTRPRTISDLASRMSVDAQAGMIDQIPAQTEATTGNHVEISLDTNDSAPSQAEGGRAEPPLAAAAATPAAGAARTTTASNGAPKARRL